MKACISSIILSISTKPIQQTQQYTLNPYSNISFFKSPQKLKNQETKAINMKYFEKNGKPIPFLEVCRRNDEEKWWIF